MSIQFLEEYFPSERLNNIYFLCKLIGDRKNLESLDLKRKVYKSFKALPGKYLYYMQWIEDKKTCNLVCKI